MLGELKEDEIQQVLKSNSIGRIGCTDGEHVYITPLNYRLEVNSVLCYSLEGLKIQMMRTHRSVCFEVDVIQNSNNWKCVIINGVFEEITDPQELNLIRPHYTEYMLRKKVSLTAVPHAETELSKEKAHPEQVFYRIRFQNISGRYESGFF
jgi:nitroimidazol reductase NimA-like FMN-containing flavoprotein (pyridoxamine 5'-phosphate oxidase superfamily)